MMRIGALLKRRDPALNDAWYLRSGTALHVEGRQPHRAEVARDLLREMDLEPGLVDEALADPTTHDDVRVDHERVTSMGGWGVPTLVFPGADEDDSRKLFGPVLIDPPTGSGTWSLAGWSSRTSTSCSGPRPQPTWPRSARCSDRTWRPVSGTRWPTPPPDPQNLEDSEHGDRTGPVVKGRVSSNMVFSTSTKGTSAITALNRSGPSGPIGQMTSPPRSGRRPAGVLVGACRTIWPT